MKYKELITFEPINEVVKFDQLSNEDYRHSLVRNFVFSETYEKHLSPRFARTSTILPVTRLSVCKLSVTMVQVSHT